MLTNAMKHKEKTTQALSTKKVFFVYKKRDRQQKKKEAKKRTDKKELMYDFGDVHNFLNLLLLSVSLLAPEEDNFCRMHLYALFPCVSSHW